MKAKAKTEANICDPGQALRRQSIEKQTQRPRSEQVLGARGTCCKNPEITFIGLGSAASAGYLFEYI